MTAENAKFTREELLRKAELMQIFIDDGVIQSDIGCGFRDNYSPDFTMESKNYRRKPKPQMVPLGPEDFGPVTWIRSGHEDMVIIGVRPGGVRVGHSWYSYESLQTSDWLYSTDRKTWKRCEKEAV